MTMAEQASRHKDPVCVMGRTEGETRRLIFVSEILNPFTWRMLQDAGLQAGMRVLDTGTGAGDVALLAAELVGPGGRVKSGVASAEEVGIDTLASRLRAGTTAAGGVVKAPDMVSAWTHRR